MKKRANMQGLMLLILVEALLLIACIKNNLDNTSRIHETGTIPMTVAALQR